MVEYVLGLDIGRVLTSGNKDLALKAIKELKIKFGKKMLFISRVSNENEKGREARNYTLKWLDKNGFYEVMEIGPERVYFCNNHSDKARICAEHKVTHFVDDRMEVLKHLIKSRVPNLYLFNPLYLEVQKHKEGLDKVVIVENWEELKDKLLQ